MKALIFLITIIFFLVPPATAAQKKPYCGELKNAFGPFNYMERFNSKESLDIVERHHFTSDVENLIRGNTSPTPAGDLDYTLRAWPNHHRALVSLFKYSVKVSSTHIKGLKWPVECYFDRAIRMNTKDAQVRSIYSAFLMHHNRGQEALEQLEVAADLEPDSAMILYNLGLLHFKQKNYDKASHYAKQAYARNFPLPGLRNKLIRVGKWRK
jgi:hypothetical protein